MILLQMKSWHVTISKGGACLHGIQNKSFVIFTSCDRKGRSWAMIAFKRLAISICKNIYYFDFWMQWQFRVFNEWLIKNLIRFWHMLRLKALNKLRQFSNILNDFRHLQILRVFKGYLITFSHFNKTLYFTCLCISTLRP